MKFPEHFVIQSVAKDLGNIQYVIEIFRARWKVLYIFDTPS